MMRTQLVVASPWPAEPELAADARSRLSWYAAVARWAPSKHNSQPWRFVVRGRALELWADPMRMLPETDPHRRELAISCGAAIEMACVAARAHGYEPQVTHLPGEGVGCLARLVEVGPWEVTEHDRTMLDAVQRRRTDRGPLDGTRLPISFAFQLQTAALAEGAALRLVSRRGDRSTLAALVERADRLLVQRGRADEELAHWLREPGDQRPDGVPTDHTRGAAASYRAEFVQRDFSTETSLPAQNRAGVDHPILAVLCTPADRLQDWLIAGRALATVLLQATAAGASASYLNQPVEDVAIRAQLRDELTLPGVAQLVLRLGVGGAVTAPPRRDCDDVIFHIREATT